MFKRMIRNGAALAIVLVLTFVLVGLGIWFDESEIGPEINQLRTKSAVMVGQGIEVDDNFFPSLRRSGFMNDEVLAEELVYHAALIKAGGDLKDPLAVEVLEIVSEIDPLDRWETIWHLQLQRAVMVEQGIRVGKLFPYFGNSSSMNEEALRRTVLDIMFGTGVWNAVDQFHMENAAMEGQSVKATEFFPRLITQLAYHTAFIKAGGDLKDPLAVAVLDFVSETDRLDPWGDVRYLRLENTVMVGQGCTSEVRPMLKTTYVLDLQTRKMEVYHLMSIFGSNGCSGFTVFPIDTYSGN